MPSSSSTAPAATNGDAESAVQIQPALLHLSNAWLNDLSSRIRARPIPWEGYQRADLVSADELKMIRSVDGKPRSTAEEVLDANGQAYAQLYIRLLAKLSRTDTLQQVLVLIGDMLHARNDRAQLFRQVSSNEEADWPWAPLIKLRDIADDFAQLKAASILTLLLVAPSSSSATAAPAPPAATSRLLELLSTLINSGTAANAQAAPAGSGVLAPPSAVGGYAEGNGADVAIQLLEGLLRSGSLRQAVWKDELRRMSALPADGSNGASLASSTTLPVDDDAPKDDAEEAPGMLRGLVGILRAGLAGASGKTSGTSTPSSSSLSSTAVVSPQMQYQVVFCFWLLSFDEAIAEDINVKFGIITVLADVARNAVKEKVVRIVLATFRNLLAKAPASNAPAMLGAKCLPLVEALALRKWSDEEIEEDIAAIKEVLAEKLKGMSSYDEYVSELSSGKLSWDNPAHELDDFWRENAARIAGTSDAEGEGLQALVRVLSSQDSTPLSLAIACHDIGKLVSASEAAKKRVTEAGAKAKIMALIAHPDADVKYRALSTVSRLVSASWK